MTAVQTKNMKVTLKAEHKQTLNSLERNTLYLLVYTSTDTDSVTNVFSTSGSELL